MQEFTWSKRAHLAHCSISCRCPPRGFDRQEAYREAQATTTQHSCHYTKLALTLPTLITFLNLPCFFFFLEANRASASRAVSLCSHKQSKSNTFLSIRFFGSRQCHTHQGIPHTAFAIFLCSFPSPKRGEDLCRSHSNITYRGCNSNHPHSASLK